MTSPEFDEPGIYRVTVAGHFNAAWCELLRNMKINNVSEPGAEHTIITGRLPDQAALLSVLNTLYDRHVVVLAVERLIAA